MARLMREALGLTTVSRYDTEFDYLGIADLKIVTAGYNCVDFHTGARIDVICPGGRDCPILRPTGVLDLADVSCSDPERICLLLSGGCCSFFG